jgi:hypothetical protein
MVGYVIAWLNANYGHGHFPPNITQRVFHHLHTDPQLFQLYQAQIAPNGVLDRHRRHRLHRLIGRVVKVHLGARTFGRRIGPMNPNAILIRSCARLCP